LTNSASTASTIGIGDGDNDIHLLRLSATASPWAMPQTCSNQSRTKSQPASAKAAYLHH
jgi:phosphoserine phosphatase